VRKSVIQPVGQLARLDRHARDHLLDACGGGDRFTYSQTRPLHASEEDETKRQGSNSRDNPEGLRAWHTELREQGSRGQRLRIGMGVGVPGLEKRA